LDPQNTSKIREKKLEERGKEWTEQLD
jgi:hypothetical protein